MQKIQVPIPPDLDYFYRGVANVFVSTGDVVLEPSNIHRSMPSSASISNRIVFIKATDYDLHNRLAQSTGTSICTSAAAIAAKLG
jgi:hypothetical protein